MEEGRKRGKGKHPGDFFQTAACGIKIGTSPKTSKGGVKDNVSYGCRWETGRCRPGRARKIGERKGGHRGWEPELGVDKDRSLGL